MCFAISTLAGAIVIGTIILEGQTFRQRQSRGNISIKKTGKKEIPLSPKIMPYMMNASLDHIKVFNSCKITKA